MKNKLTLLEDAEEIIEPMQETKLSNEEISNFINNLIKGEFDAIELYNSVLATIKDQEMPHADEAELIINDIVSEEYVHIGQLEKLLQTIIPEANSIDDGIKEAEADIAPTVSES